MKLDIDFSPSDGWLDQATIQRIENAQMTSSSIEHFDLTMERVPREKTLSIPRAPSAHAIEGSKVLKSVQDRGLRYRLSRQFRVPLAEWLRLYTPTNFAQNSVPHAFCMASDS
jgi:hypothetical protein